MSRNSKSPLSKKAMGYLRRLVKDDIQGSMPEAVDAELLELGIKVQTESVRWGRRWETTSYIMAGMEKAEALVRGEQL